MGCAFFCASAQEVIQSGAVRVALPSKEWVRMTPPATGSATKNQAESLKPVLYAEAYKGAVKLRVSQYDYPAGTTEKELAVFVQHLRNNYQSHAFGTVQEMSQSVRGIPTVNLEVKYRGWSSMHSHTIFCDKRAYLVEIGGADEYGKEADQCWAGLSVMGETPLAGATFEALTGIRAKAQADLLARSTPPSRGWIYILQAVGALAGMMGLLWLSMKAAEKIRKSGIKFGSKRRRRRRRSLSPIPVASRAQGMGRSAVAVAVVNR